MHNLLYSPTAVALFLHLTHLKSWGKEAKVKNGKTQVCIPISEMYLSL